LGQYFIRFMMIFHKLHPFILGWHFSWILGKTPIFSNLIGKLVWRNIKFGLVPDIPLGTR
jgi:hypothetical protein